MTEFEMAYLLTDMQAMMATQATTSLTVVSGFLIAGYIAAHRLNRLMVGILLGIYTYWFLGTAFQLSRQVASHSGLILKMHNYAAAGKGLEWHAAKDAMAPRWVLEAAPTSAVLFASAIFAASIVFFFQCRRMNHKIEAGTWHPKV